jgi:hypothetical protein
MMKAPYEDFLHTLTNAPGRAADMAAAVSEKIADLVQFSPVDWLIDYATDWKQTAITWISSMTGYGAMGIIGVWLVRKVVGRVWQPRTRQDATWLRWPVRHQALALSLLKAGGYDERFVRPGDGNAILVNAYISGPVREILKQNNIEVML